MSVRADLNDDRYTPTGETESTRPAAGTGVWYPKPKGSFVPNLIISSGAAGQGAAAVTNPESGVYNAWTAKSSVTGGLNSLEQGQQWIFNLVAAGRNEGARYKTSASSVHDKFVNEAARYVEQGQRVTPVELAWREAVANGWIKDGQPTIGTDSSSSSGGGGYGGGGGYSGPTTSVDTDYAHRRDIRVIADSIGMEMLGRAIDDSEMDRILKRIRKYEKNNPTVSTSDNGVPVRNTASKQGATNAGRQQIIERMLAKNPEYGDYQSATTVMSWFDDWMNERLQKSG